MNVRTITLVRVLLPMLVGLFTAGSVSGQGQLTPPGSPAATMKTLEQVEPGRPISSLPFDITEAGSYYITSNLTGQAGTNGITILSDDVTLDLRGFSLTGGPGTLDGIGVPNPQVNITIQHGSVAHWGEHGVNAFAANNSSLRDLKAYSNGWESASTRDGLRIGENSLIVSCIAIGNQDDGIVADLDSLIIESVSSANADFGIVGNLRATIARCSASKNGSLGIISQLNAGLFSCVAISNGSYGIWGGAGIISDCTASHNASDGIRAGLFSVVSKNGASIVKGCTAASNGGNGIYALRQCYAVNNACWGNRSSDAMAGIVVVPGFGEGCRIEGNNVVSNGVGIAAHDNRNIVIRNSASGNATNYSYKATNSIGEIVNVAGVGQFTNTNPWANFEF